VTKCQDTIIKYQQTKKTEKDIFESINAQDLFDATNILEYINDALKTLRDLFIQNLKAGLEKQGQFELYKLLIFFIMIFIIFLGIYIPYLNNLSVRIWKTKGMLNMIPMDILKTNIQLQEHVLHKDIYAAMK